MARKNVVGDIAADLGLGLREDPVEESQEEETPVPTTAPVDQHVGGGGEGASLPTHAPPASAPDSSVTPEPEDSVTSGFQVTTRRGVMKQTSCLLPETLRERMESFIKHPASLHGNLTELIEQAVEDFLDREEPLLDRMLEFKRQLAREQGRK